jgi:hypothetical protein
MVQEQPIVSPDQLQSPPKGMLSEFKQVLLSVSEQ